MSDRLGRSPLFQVTGATESKQGKQSKHGKQALPTRTEAPAIPERQPRPQGKRMFAVRLRPELIEKLRDLCYLERKTKEQLMDEVLSEYFKTTKRKGD